MHSTTRSTALLQSEVPNIPDAGDPCLDEKVDEDLLEHETKKRWLPMPTKAVSESRPTEGNGRTMECGSTPVRGELGGRKGP